ncbi:MAG: porin [Bacteroides sp.]|nr:porin [Bacteroides sp.]
MKNLRCLLSILALSVAVQSMAQKGVGNQFLEDLKQNTKVGGYVIARYNYNDRAGQSKNGGFDFQYVRAYAESRVLDDFYFKVQMQINGAPAASGENRPRLLDAFIEWQKYKFARIKIGQFDRAFSMEVPFNPWVIGFHDNAQVINMLGGMTDRVGEHYSNGRDLGLQVQGDFLPVGKDGHELIHYQVGVFNGQGINHSDNNKQKDLMGVLQFKPLKELAIGVTGWAGDYTANGITVDRNRWGVGIDYESDWVFRTEYISSQGHKISDYDTTTGQLKSDAGGDGADGWYVALGVPVADKFRIYSRWDVYRDQKESDTQKTQYGLTAEYYFMKNLKAQLNYFFTEDKSVSVGRYYNTIDFQVYFRF